MAPVAIGTVALRGGGTRRPVPGTGTTAAPMSGMRSEPAFLLASTMVECHFGDLYMYSSIPGEGFLYCISSGAHLPDRDSKTEVGTSFRIAEIEIQSSLILDLLFRGCSSCISKRQWLRSRVGPL